MIRRHRCISGYLPEGHLITSQIDDVGTIPIALTDPAIESVAASNEGVAVLEAMAEQWLHKVYTEIEDCLLSKERSGRRRA